MAQKTEFCILGAGLAGLSLADALQERDLSSVIIDKGGIAHGASGTPGGLVNPATGRSAKKTWKAEHCYEAIAQNLAKVQAHTAKPFYQQNGLLRPALLKKMGHKMKEQYEATTWPEGWCEWKTEAEIKDMHPGISCVDGGLWLPIGLTVDVGAYLEAYASYLTDQGLSFFLHAKPFITPQKNSWKIEFQKSIIESRNLVFATGHHTETSYWWDWLPFNLIKGQVARFKTDSTLSFDHSISSLGYIASVPEDDTFVVGSTYKHNFDNVEPDEEGASYLRQRLKRTLPHLETEARIIDQWAGVRIIAPNRKPVLGHHPVHPNLHIFTGLGSKGLLYSKFLADHYADHLCGDSELFKDVSINRFNS